MDAINSERLYRAYARQQRFCQSRSRWSAVHRQLGNLEMNDQLAGISYL
jgi:hypothetical protein